MKQTEAQAILDFMRRKNDQLEAKNRGETVQTVKVGYQTRKDRQKAERLVLLRELFHKHYGKKSSSF